MNDSASLYGSQPFDIISIDCDATLSQVEGVDVLAKKNGVGDQVAELTRTAMRETGLSNGLYQKRLELIKPTRDQLRALGELYAEEITPDARAVIDLMQSLGKRVYVLSAGLLPAVQLLTDSLGIPREHVFAVDCYFDEAGHYAGYDESSPLSRRGGKVEILNQVREPGERVVHIGDGMNDAETQGHVDCFIGFGGGGVHEKIKSMSDTYITENTFSAFLPYILTEEEKLSFLRRQESS